MKRFNTEIVKSAARGRWNEIFEALAPSLKEALEKPGHHVPCPVHGGVDGFRLFPNFREDGGGICNSCGAQSNGFSMLMWVNHWTYGEAVKQVAQFLGLSPDGDSIVSVATEGAKFSGKVMFAGEAVGRFGKRFVVRLNSDKGTVKQCWGADLKRAIETAKIQAGDNALLTLVCTQKVKKADGKTFKKNLWIATKLESDSEKAARLALEDTERLRRLQSLETMWLKAKPLDWTDPTNPVVRYLIGRGIRFLPIEADVMTRNLRFVDNLEYVDEDGSKSYHPAMIAAVKDKDGRLVTIHRTYLTAEGAKAEVKRTKKLMPIPSDRKLAGSAIRLGKPHQRILCVAEGIETALSVCIGTGLPCWSAINANGLETVDIPASADTIFIFADKDLSGTGQKSAQKLRTKLQREGKLSAVISIAEEIPPCEKGLDWNDVLIAEGEEGFPVRVYG